MDSWKQGKRGARDKDRRLPAIEGIVPSLHDLPIGCRFHDRCGLTEDRCVQEEPELVSSADGSQVRCHTPVNEATTS